MKRTLLLIAFLCATIAASAQSPASGYRSYVDLGHSFATQTNEYYDTSESHIDVSTSHGYSYKGLFYVGGGVGLTSMYSWGFEILALPVFADLRAYAPTKGAVKPYLGLRTGVSCGLTLVVGGPTMGVGFYLNPSLGIEIDRVDISLSYVQQEHCAYNMGEGIMFRLGYRFGK
ncbi:MAG: hypothetical protein IJ377_04190 [Rikenellaceae bacterium]|nr:hypothetical protein [Rikenellaceae bacterium]